MKKLFIPVVCLLVLLTACGTNNSSEIPSSEVPLVNASDSSSETDSVVTDTQIRVEEVVSEPFEESADNLSGEGDLEEIPTQTPEPEPYSPILDETEDMGMEYVDKIIFIGDSTSYRMKMNGVLSDGKDTQQIWTGSNGTMTLSYQSFIKIPYKGREVTLREAAAMEQPEYMIITLGLNGVAFMDEEYFTAQYCDLVEGIMEASPDTAIMLQSVFPVSATYPNLHQINRDVLEKCNSWILGIAEKYGLRYLNTTSILVDETGYMKPEYDCGDGFHMNAEGLTEVVNYIRTHGYVAKPVA